MYPKKLKNDVTILAITEEGEYIFTYKSFDGSFQTTSWNPADHGGDAVEVALIEAVKEIKRH